MPAVAGIESTLPGRDVLFPDSKHNSGDGDVKQKIGGEELGEPDWSARRCRSSFILQAVTTGQDSAESHYAKLQSLQHQDLSLLGGLTVGGQPLT